MHAPTYQQALFLRRLIFSSVVLSIVLWWFDQVELSCPFYTYLGLHCPMCRSTRATHALVELRIVDAFLLNPLLFLWLYLFSISFIEFTILMNFQDGFARLSLMRQKIPLFDSQLFWNNKRIQTVVKISMICNIVYLNWYI